MSTLASNKQISILSSELENWLNLLPVSMFASNSSGDILFINPACCQLLGHTKDTTLNVSHHLSYCEDKQIPYQLRAQLADTPGQTGLLEQRFVHTNGKILRCAHHMSQLVHCDEQHPIYLSQLVDLSAQKQAEQQTKLLGQFLEHMNDGIYVVDSQTAKIINCNHIAHARLGYSREELLKLNVSQINHELTLDKVWPEYVRQVKSNTVVTREGCHTRKDGSNFPIEGNISFITDGEQSYLLAVIRDISHRKAQEQLIWKQANYDPLTNLPNRRLINDRLQQAILGANRNQTRVAILFLDLDRFKAVNDSLGHNMGDQLLVETSKRLIACIRDTDTLARLGGDEFTIILPDIKHRLNIDKVAGKVLSCFQDMFLLGTHKVFITTSIGVSIYPDNGADGASLLKSADQAMYSAKACGRNSYQYFTPSIQRQAREKANIATALHGALKKDQFYLVYQPIQTLKNNHIGKAEALLRWQSDKYGDISPREFIPIAEETGLIVEIGDWVFHQVVKQMVSWREQGMPLFQISINTAPIQFSHPSSLVDKWLDIMQKNNLDSDAIALEISESSLVSAQASVCEKLLSLHSQQVEIHLDDFGSGYSSLHNLKQREIDIIKLDEQFISHLQHDKDSQILCETLIKLAHKLNMGVIGKNVETEQQKNILQQLQCDYIQGHVLSQPLTAPQLSSWLKCYPQN